MIGSEREARMDSTASDRSPPRIGGPLSVLALLLAAWVGARTMMWENPFGMVAASEALIERLAQAPDSRGAARGDGPPSDWTEPTGLNEAPFVQTVSYEDHGPGPSFSGSDRQLATGHHSLWQAALTMDLRETSWQSRRSFHEAAGERQAKAPVFPGTPPFAARTDKPNQKARLDRWSLGSWAFLRSGSTRSRIAPGPAPVYGASQAGAILQFRAAPHTDFDPRAYLRATRSLVDQPESEAAAGVSARPVAALPVRAAAEIRVTDNRFDSDMRPAAFAITEVPPLALPLGLTGEVYAAAGYVGGKADTGFVDGQGTLTRNIANFDLRRPDDTRLSVGAGAWGGAQKGVHRVDVGPTVRLDLSLGTVPARVSIDYRERVDGDARPSSGVAATLSTQF
ncbi:MAG: hypothetical protein AAF251_16940 [Pseudomonadota bacterium]